MSSRLIEIFEDEKLVKRIKINYHVYFNLQNWKVQEREKLGWKWALFAKK